MCTAQELNSKAESKFNRLKAQAKAKITTLNKELEKLRREHGVPALDSSAQVMVIHVHTCIHNYTTLNFYGCTLYMCMIYMYISLMAVGASFSGSSFAV